MSCLSRRAALLLVLAAGSFITTASVAEDTASDRALITVRTLVIDALGTRTVDTDVARVPFGGTGLLTRKVPYGGPGLSFRLAVTVGLPQEAGIALNMSADIWNGAPSPMPPAERMWHREEATVLAAESSYLLELDHSEKSDRRILLSISARRASESEIAPPAADSRTGTVHFDVEVTRILDGTAEPVDARAMSTMVGVAATYTSGVKVPGASPGEASRFVGLGISITPERTSGNLVTIRSELTGADFADAGRTRLVPIQLRDVRTVTSGTRFDLSVDLNMPADDRTSTPSLDPPKPRVSYRIAVTPRVVQPARKSE